MIRYPVKIDFGEADSGLQRARVAAHHSRLPYPGDGFLPVQQLEGTPHQVLIDDRPAGLIVIKDEILMFCVLSAATRRYHRQAVEAALRRFGVTTAYVLSWDAVQLDLIGNFAREIANQAYQFQVLDPAELRTEPGPGDPLADLALSPATAADLPYLTGADFIDDYSDLLPAGRVRIARWDGRPAGIGLLVPHPLHDGVVDLGMFTEPEFRRRGVGRTVIAAAARETVRRELTPVAGCWWRNRESRHTLEAAGLTCVGTIFRLTLDPDRFAD